MPTRSTVPQRIPPFTVLRFARYLNFLCNLPEDRTEISSAEMARIIGIKATQLRQDFFTLGGFGRQGRKYDTRVLQERLRDVLYLQEGQHMVLVGAGNLGQALANYQDFERFNLYLRGIFDTNPKLIGLRLRGIEVMAMEKMSTFIAEQSIELGIICVPHQVAQQVCDILVEAGIKGIWNFSPENVIVPDGVVVQNENLSVGIMNLSHQLNSLARDRSESR
ncbi:MAG: redox-sensing transcriptional repressor Rex [Candidatus Delongbacteria bacterium]|nr:redox-sensing transcriptional repressor Rex [Candidatus Cloacimonadota bacterium]MCB9472766.1 redox-sensing transcriptional repressor Rex [Candidatus Delongbacteria bacterium]